MRISDWSSDVCSSDLQAPPFAPPLYQAVNEEIKKKGKTIAYDAQPGVSQQNRPEKHWQVASSSHPDPKAPRARDEMQRKRCHERQKLSKTETGCVSGLYSVNSCSGTSAAFQNSLHHRVLNFEKGRNMTDPRHHSVPPFLYRDQGQQYCRHQQGGRHKAGPPGREENIGAEEKDCGPVDLRHRKGLQGFPQAAALNDGGGQGQELNDHQRNQHRAEEHTSELQSLMRTSYTVFCLKKKKHK